MIVSAARGRRAAMAARVVRADRLTPSFVRVVLGGQGLSHFSPVPYADAYVKLAFIDPAVVASFPVDDGALDLTELRARTPADAHPRLRTYTVRRWDAAAQELTLDMIVHGDAGIAGPWAADAKPGDTAWVLGPGGAYSPDPGADHHLLVGDESALPAIAVAVERLPAGSRATVLVEIPGPGDELRLAADPGAVVDVSWLHRGNAVVGTRLVEAVRALVWPEGRVQAFVHGEAGFVADLRRYLRLERRLPREDVSISGYWRLGADDEGWRAVKRAWTDELEALEVSAGVA